jgi:hypothetical protein
MLGLDLTVTYALASACQRNCNFVGKPWLPGSKTINEFKPNEPGRGQ